MTMELRKVFTGAVGLAVLLVGLASNAAPAQAATNLVVDDDGMQCPTADFDTIQAAVNELGASPSGTITVCPGIYSEPVFVFNASNLKLIGKPGAYLISDSIPASSSPLTVKNSTNVTVQGFTFDGLGNVSSAGTATALDFQHSSGLIQKNVFTRWHTPVYVGNAPGIRVIHVLGGENEAVTITGNTINQFQTNGIVAEGTLALTISKNKITAPTATANTLHGINLFASATGAPSGLITGNTLTSDDFPGEVGSTGITVSEASNVTVSSNTLTHWEFGIYFSVSCAVLGNASDNVITKNILREVGDGIDVDSSANSCDTHADRYTVTGNKITDTAAQGVEAIFFRARGFSTHHGNALNELVTGNTITHFNETVVQSQLTDGTLSGTFAPNTVHP